MAAIGSRGLESALLEQQILRRSHLAAGGAGQGNILSCQHLVLCCDGSIGKFADAGSVVRLESVLCQAKRLIYPAGKSVFRF